MKNRITKVDILILAILPLAATLISILFQANLLASTILFFGVPCLWLGYKQPQKVPKALLFSIVLVLPVFVIGDYIATLDKAWYITATVFSVRAFGILTYEEIIWGILGTTMAVLFYENYLDKPSKKESHTGFRYFAGAIFVMIALFLVVNTLAPALLQVNYAYLIFGTLFEALPLIVFVYRYPKKLTQILTVLGYFTYVCLLHELVQLQLNNWSFPGTHFIGWIEIIGYRFPLEELVFFVMILAAAVVVYYEIFDDDRK